MIVVAMDVRIIVDGLSAAHLRGPARWRPVPLPALGLRPGGTLLKSDARDDARLPNATLNVEKLDLQADLRLKRPRPPTVAAVDLFCSRAGAFSRTARRRSGRGGATGGHRRVYGCPGLCLGHVWRLRGSGSAPTLAIGGADGAFGGLGWRLEVLHFAPPRPE